MPSDLIQIDNNSSPVPAWLSVEASSMNRLDEDPEGTELRLRKTAELLTENEMAHLARTATDTTLDHNTRFLPVYLLSLNPQTPVRHFTEVALMEDAGDFAELLSLKAVREIRKRYAVEDLVAVHQWARSDKVREAAGLALKEVIP